MLKSKYTMICKPCLIGFSQDRLYLIISLCNIYLGFFSKDVTLLYFYSFHLVVLIANFIRYIRDLTNC